MATTYSDTEVRVQYEYLKTQVQLWQDMLNKLAGLAVTFSKEFSIQYSSKVEFNYLKELLDESEKNIKFVRDRAFEAQMIALALAERLSMIIAWYENGSKYSQALLRTATDRR